MMLRPLLLAAAILTALPAGAETQRRCGWYSDPAPGTVYLKDAHGFWWISNNFHPAPGLDQASSTAFERRARKSFLPVSAFESSCACVDGEFGAVGSMEVRSITRLEALPIARCEDDRNLSDSPFFGE